MNTVTTCVSSSSRIQAVKTPRRHGPASAGRPTQGTQASVGRPAHQHTCLCGEASTQSRLCGEASTQASTAPPASVGRPAHRPLWGGAQSRCLRREAGTQAKASVGRPAQVDASALKAGVSRGGLGRGAGHGSAMRSGRRPGMSSGESMGLTEEGRLQRSQLLTHLRPIRAAPTTPGRILRHHTLDLLID